MRISLFARLNSAKSEIRISLVNNGALWLVRHVATAFVNKTKQEPREMAESSLSPSPSEFFSPSIIAFLSEQESLVEQFEQESPEEQFDDIVGSLSFDAYELLATPTTPPTTGVAVQPSTSSAQPSTSSALHSAAADSELRRLKDKNKNKNTEKSTNTWANKFADWRKEKGINISPAETSATELDEILQHFFAEVKKKDGSNYEPDSLRTMLGALDRYFRNAGYRFRIIRDDEFVECRQVLNGKAIELREMGKGKRRNKADGVTREEEEILWAKGVLGDSNPTSLNYTIFYTISQQFGTRGRQEHHQIRIEELKFVKNAGTGETEYIEWVEGLTKTRQGGLSKKERRVPQRMFAVGGDRCPVRLLERMISRRPSIMKMSGPLYLTPLQQYQGRDVWYSRVPVGINKIDGFMKAMSIKAGLDKTNKKYTNHSARKTTVKKLQKGGISNDKIVSITGHSSELSLRDYVETDIADHASMSKILSLPVSHPSRPVLQEQCSNTLTSPQLHPAPASNSYCQPVYPTPLPQYQPNVAFTPQCQSSVPPPQYVFNSCNVYFGTSCSTSTSTQFHATNPSLHKKRPRAFIESDDSD